VAFVVIFLTLVLSFSCLGGVYFHTAQGNLEIAARLTVAAGATAFVSCMAGWWIFAAIMLAALDFPFQLPVGDLSGFIKGKSERLALKGQKDMV